MCGVRWAGGQTVQMGYRTGIYVNTTWATHQESVLYVGCPRKLIHMGNPVVSYLGSPLKTSELRSPDAIHVGSPFV